MSEQMNPIPAQPGPPPLVRSESMKNTPAAKMLAVGCAGCGCVVVILICLAALFVFSMKRAANAVDPTVETFLVQLNEGKYEDAYAGTGDKYKSQISKDEFFVMCRVVVNALGAYQSKTAIGVFTNRDIGKSKTTSVNYTAHYQKGDATLTVLLESAGADFKIIGTKWDSKLIEAAAKCPSCGAIQRQFGRYCGSCGKPMLPEDAQASPPGVPPTAEATQ